MKFPFKLIDLTHELYPAMPTWGHERGFLIDEELLSATENEGPDFCLQKLEMDAGIGTHIDAPRHCYPYGKSVAELDLNDLCAPCVVIDVSKQVKKAAYVVTLEDIKKFENVHGEVQEDAFVIIHTGWSQHWENHRKYRNNLKFPSISEEVARYLLGRNIVGLGIDTLGPDVPSSGFIVHKLVLGADKFIVENIANAQAMPAVGGFCMVMPLKVEGGAEAPVCLVGLVKRLQR